MVYKKVYDENNGTFIYVDPWTLTPVAGPSRTFEVSGAGIFDALASVGQKVFSSSIKEASKKALETAGKQALESGAKKIGSEVGNLAANKVVNVIKGKPQARPPGEMIIKELIRSGASPSDANAKKQASSSNDVDMRVNKLLSGSGPVNMRVNRLLLGQGPRSPVLRTPTPRWYKK